mmetsp:Transcript_4819/g.11964  ORF Transcript_4819/g.11964 Transcript_4819/m.11964 type:complete len:359 (-) Transcript_4819:144-1220(-)
MQSHDPSPHATDRHEACDTMGMAARRREAGRARSSSRAAQASLLVLTPLEHVQVDEVHRGQEARLLLGGRGGREDERVVVVGVARAAQPAHIAAGPVALHRAYLRLVAGRGDRHHEDRVEARGRAAVDAPVCEARRYVHLVLGLARLVVHRVAQARHAQQRRDAEPARPVHPRAAQRTRGRRVERADLLRVQQAAAARDGALEGAEEFERRHLALGPSKPAEPALHLHVHEAARHVAARREDPDAELAVLVAAVAAQARRLLSDLEQPVDQRTLEGVIIQVSVERRCVSVVGIGAHGERGPLLAGTEHELQQRDALAHEQTRRLKRKHVPPVRHWGRLAGHNLWHHRDAHRHGLRRGE